jgi:hypothetical protein
MSEPAREKIAADWASRGFGCDLWTDPPGQTWEDFTHATDELVTVLEGEMEFEVGGKVHSARNIGKSTARWLYGYRHLT